jgi:hypothetical protein
LRNVEGQCSDAGLEGLARRNAKPFDVFNEFGKTQMQTWARKIAAVKLAIVDTSLKAAIIRGWSFQAAAFS